MNYNKGQMILRVIYRTLYLTNAEYTVFSVQNYGHNSNYLIGLLWGSSEMMYAKWLTQRSCSRNGSNY